MHELNPIIQAVCNSHCQFFIVWKEMCNKNTINTTSYYG